MPEFNDLSIDPGRHETYRGLPALAGIATMADAMKPGLTVDQCVQRVKRYHYAFKRLHEILTARITAEPIYELKTAFSLHAYLCAEHTQAMRTRVAEMREPPLGLDVVPDTNLEVFFDEILGAPATGELIAGIYQKALPALKAAMERHIRDTNPLVDHPSIRDDNIKSLLPTSPPMSCARVQYASGRGGGGYSNVLPQFIQEAYQIYPTDCQNKAPLYNGSGKCDRKTCC